MSKGKTYQFSVSRLVSTAGTSFVVVGCIVIGGGAGFFNIPAMLITVGIAFFLSLGTFGVDALKFVPASLACLVCTPVKPNVLNDHQIKSRAI